MANYSHYLIWTGVNAAAIVKCEGVNAFVQAVESTAEPFILDVSREFFATVLPAAGFEDIGEGDDIANAILFLASDEVS